METRCLVHPACVPELSNLLFSLSAHREVMSEYVASIIRPAISLLPYSAVQGGELTLLGPYWGHLGVNPGSATY